MKIEITVFLKQSVLDVEGRTIAKALVENGFDFVSDVKKGKIFYVDVANGTPDDRIKDMCEKILANTVIETFSYKIV